MPQHHLFRSLGSFLRQAKAADDGSTEDGDEDVEHQHKDIGKSGQSVDIGFCLVILTGADTLTNYGNHRKSDGSAGDDGEAGNRVADSVGSDGSSAVGSNHSLHDDFAQLEHPVFQAVWNTDGKDIFNHTRMEVQVQVGINVDDVV